MKYIKDTWYKVTYPNGSYIGKNEADSDSCIYFILLRRMDKGTDHNNQTVSSFNSYSEPSQKEIEWFHYCNSNKPLGFDEYLKLENYEIY